MLAGRSVKVCRWKSTGRERCGKKKGTLDEDGACFEDITRQKRFGNQASCRKKGSKVESVHNELQLTGALLKRSLNVLFESLNHI